MRELIRQILREALGVPEGSTESGEMLYNLILERLKRLDANLDNKKTFRIKTDIKISDYDVKKVILNIDIQKLDYVPEIHFYSMGFKQMSRYATTGKPRLITILTPDTIDVSINFAGPKDSTRKDLIKYFKEDKIEITSSLSHELGHAYNIYKKPSASIKTQSEYNAYQNVSFPFRAINDFIFNLYYIHSVENIVRPIEVASRMRSEDIGREGFYEFITNNKTYTKLKEINNFSYQRMREELMNDIDSIKVFFKRRLNIDIDDFETDDEIIDELLRIVYVNLVNQKIDIARRMMTTSGFEDLMGFIGNKQDFFDKIATGFIKYESRPLDFFKDEEKRFKMISEKMMKKISKLFAMAKVDKSSIKDWELHHKINKTGEQLETEIKYKRRIR